MKVSVFSTKLYDRQYFEKFNLTGKHQLTFFEASLGADTSNLTLGFNAVCVFVNDQIDKATIEKLAHNQIKIIALRCAGFNNVDLKAAAENGLRVVRVPAYSPHSIAEHAVALILSLNRKTFKVYNRIRESNFSLDGLVGFNLYQKTVGVIGTGKIGSVFCEMMLGFGCKVLAYDLFESELLKEKGVEYSSLDQLLLNSDIISLHCPLTPDTHYLFNRGTFSKIKKGAMLINTSRGGLIHTEDAIEVLRSGKLGYLGIDVYEQEENLFFRNLSGSIVQDETIELLTTFPNVLITPHQGFLTKEALDQIATTTLQNLTDFEMGLPLENEVVM